MDVIKAAFLLKDYCHEHLSGRNGGCKTCPLSNFRMWNESVRGCAVARPSAMAAASGSRFTRWRQRR